MSRDAYYNDNDPYVCAWAKNLMEAGHIPYGMVDGRSITDIHAGELLPFTQCHFFAGILGWPYALQLAGWPPALPLWTASCPCQPFSTAGQQRGTADERHLWPVLFGLLRVCRPQYCFGEQVASAIGHGWLDGISADLEAEGYTVGATVLGAHSVGAPHIRQRLYWMAYTTEHRYPQYQDTGGGRAGMATDGKGNVRFGDHSSISRMADARRSGNECGSRSRETLGTDCPPQGPEAQWKRSRAAAGDCGATRRLDDAEMPERWGTGSAADDRRRPQEARRSSALGGLDDTPGPRYPSSGQRQSAEPQWGQRLPGMGCDPSFWDAYDLPPCRDGKTRRIESGLQPLAHGVPARMGRLRAYGNAIVPQVAATFLAACMECLEITPSHTEVPYACA